MTIRSIRLVALLALAAPAAPLAPSRAALAQAGADSPAPPAPPPAYAPPVAAPTASASIANPATSVIGWFQGAAGNDHGVQAEPFSLREAELALQSQVDPFSRADFILSAGPEGLDIEEGYLTWLALPGRGQAKIGKFRTDLGKFNRTHAGETPFADRPLAPQAFLGAEGLSTTGVSLSAMVPNPLDLYWDVTANVGAAPDSTASPVFQPGSRSDLLALGRTSVFVPLRETADLNLGASYANARANPALRAEGGRAQVGEADLTLHWKNPRRSIYRSLVVQVEAMAERGTGPGAKDRVGGFGYALYQFARQWKLGVRADRTDRPGSPSHLSGALALLQYQPSEFSAISVQARRVRDSADGRDRDSAYLKWTFNIGPHGAHPY
jgi:hypothetical protein